MEELFPEYLWIKSFTKFRAIKTFWKKELRAIKTFWNQAADHILLLHIKFKKKTKRGLELVYLPHFLPGFEEKYLSRYIHYLTKFYCLPAFTS